MAAGSSGSSAIRDLETMWRIRAFEEKASELFARGKISGLLHLAIGQEATAVGVCGALQASDQVFSGHRPHAHAIAKGADIGRMFAELAGRRTGYCGGKGGSMHLAAPEVGFVTATGVVAGNLPLALGSALASQGRGKTDIAVAFFGDGAVQTGLFHECLNLASLWRLPVVLVCENNGRAEFSPLSAHTVVERLADHADVYGIPTETTDGNDLPGVRAAMDDAVDRARSGRGPSFLEFLTQRLRGHYEGDPTHRRNDAERTEAEASDPIGRYARLLQPMLGDTELEEIAVRARAAVELAAEEALAAPWPEEGDLLANVMAGS